MSSLATIALSGGIAGLLDITATGILRRAAGTRFQTLLQYIASGALGNRAFQGGLPAALLGLLLHFLIAILWAAAYFTLSQHLRMVLLHPWLSGALYGVLVHLLMSLVVVPNSRAVRRPFAWSAWLTQLVIHIACIGLPIALIQVYLQ